MELDMVFLPEKETELHMVRGTTMTLEIELTAEDGQPYVMLQGDVVRFGVKQAPGVGVYRILKETGTLTDGIGTVQITPEDTERMEPGRYAYDIGLQSGDDYFMAVGWSDFVLEPNVTEKE